MSDWRMDKDDVIKFIDGKIFYYSDYINFLYEQLELKDNIIKEVREYIETKYLLEFDDFEKPFILTDKNDWNKLLEILDKEKENGKD